MNSLYFGIVIGIFLGLAGERFLVFMIRTLKERSTKEYLNTKESIKQMVEEIMEEK